jgi:hypothetical protein
VSIILLLVHEAVKYYSNQLATNANYTLFRCYIAKIGYQGLINLCIFLSSCISFERALIICFDGKMNASRWRLYATTIIFFAITSGSVIPIFVYKCEWHNMLNPQITRDFYNHFYITVGITVYFLATLLTLISFAYRIRRYGMENGSYIRTFLKLLYTHLSIFVPPIAYSISQIPYTIVYNTKGLAYFQYGISTVEFIVKVLVETLTGVPTVTSWLLFVYPSRVYMTEFYLNTWSGRHLANISIFFKSYNDKKENNHLSTTNLIDNEYDNRVNSINQ